MEDILAKILDDQVNAINDEFVANEISESIGYHNKDVQSESKDAYCSSLRQKFIKHQSSVEDTIVLLTQQTGEREIVLQACKSSKFACAVSGTFFPLKAVSNYTNLAVSAKIFIYKF